MHEGAAGQVDSFLKPEQAGAGPGQRSCGAGVQWFAVANVDVQAGARPTCDTPCVNLCAVIESRTPRW